MVGFFSSAAFSIFVIPIWHYNPHQANYCKSSFFNTTGHTLQLFIIFVKYILSCIFTQKLNMYNTLWFNSVLGHVVVFGGNTPTPSTYEILNMENLGDWMQTNLTLNDQAKESINSLKTIQTSFRLILQKISIEADLFFA
jgi:hypothetical protein